MHRSMDLIREILLAMEASADGFTQPIMLKGYSEEEIGYHCLLSVSYTHLTLPTSDLV